MNTIAQARALIAAASTAPSLVTPSLSLLERNSRRHGNGNLHLPRDLQYTDSGKPMSKRRKRRLKAKT